MQEENSSKIAVCTIAYNEADMIGACIRNWKGLVDKHLVLVSSQPWNGIPGESDNTVEIAKKEGAEVIIGYWENEQMQRNWGLARLYDYDYVLIIDPDEFYLKEDQKKIIDRLNNPYDYVNRNTNKLSSFRAGNMITYWKTTNYVFDPPDKHKPFIAVDPKQVRFWNKRELMGITKEPPNIEYSDIIPITIHHLSWVKSDEKVKEKIETYSHNKDIKENWFNDVWLKWKPNSEMLVRPYGSISSEKSKAKYSQAPKEIVDILEY